jgi:hypothetical protein
LPAARFFHVGNAFVFACRVLSPGILSCPVAAAFDAITVLSKFLLYLYFLNYPISQIFNPMLLSI